MKIIATLNGVKVDKIIPVDYGSMSFKDWYAICDVEDELKRLGILLDIDEQTFRRATINNLESVILMLRFLDKPMSYVVPKTIIGYKVPQDLELTQKGRYEDLKVVLDEIESMAKEGGKTKEIIKKYLEICCIFMMPDYIDAGLDDQLEFQNKFWQAPCEEVMAIGNFTLVKWIGLRLNIKQRSPRPPSALKKARLALGAWLRSMVFSIRFALWKRKLRTDGMNF